MYPFHTPISASEKVILCTALYLGFFIVNGAELKSCLSWNVEI